MSMGSAWAVVSEFNTAGGTSATNGLHFYIEDTTHIQVKRLNGTGQVYYPNDVPPSNNLDNGIFLRANGKVYGPSHGVGGFTPTGGMYDSYSIGTVAPGNPSATGVQQTITSLFGIASGPQVSVVWKYTTPLDFMTAEVTLTIPATYTVSAAKPVRYYHVFDTYLGGSDNGCGVRFTDSNGKQVVGTYPPASGSSCPSSTSIPAGVSIVESFRERSGLPFSNYCAAGWSSFYSNGSPHCSVLQPSVMSNTIVTSYQDTGIGIEYDFTAAGTYTFSYDFVIGSPLVPPYDHLEIQHDGSGTLCPETATVLACTSATVPCPASSIVNSGTLTGNVTVSPTSPAKTAAFSIGSAAATQNVALTGLSVGSYTLGSSAISSVPLNGTKCWNTTSSSASCSLTIANTPCIGNYECTESGAAYKNLKATPTDRNPLYTKLAGTAFGFDVYALKSDGTQELSYTGPVKIELVDGSAACSSATSYQTVTPSQALSGGKYSVPASVTVNNAYKNVSCRVTDVNNTALQFCSSDKFAVRPPSFAATVTKADNSALSNPITAGLDDLKATVSMPTAGYSGSAGIYPSLSMNNGSVQGKGTLTKADAGNTVMLDPASPASTDEVSFAVASSAAGSGNFRYHDAGTLTLAIRDKSYTSIDQPGGDCVIGSISNGLTGGKYGCDIGVDKQISRFIPDHFTVAGSITAACSAGGFTYMDDARLSINFTIAAKSKAEITASQYANACPTAGSCNLTLTAQNGSAQIDISRLGPLASFSGASSAGAGIASSYQSTTWLNGVYAVSGSAFKYARLTAPDGAYDNFKLKAAVADPDGVAIAGADTIGETKIRYGRIALANAHGSERLALPIPMKLQYYQTGSGWRTNTDDSCTQIALPGGIEDSIKFNYSALSAKNNLSAAGNSVKAYLKNASGIVRGNQLSLASPGNAAVGPGSGYVDLYFDLVNIPTPMPWLNFNWKGKLAPTAADLNPTVRATFGVFKNANEFIYMREMY